LAYIQKMNYWVIYYIDKEGREKYFTGLNTPSYARYEDNAFLFRREDQAINKMNNLSFLYPTFQFRIKKIMIKDCL